MTLKPGYDWEQDKNGKWRLWEFERPRPIDNWYREAVRGYGRLVRDQDNKPLPRFESVEAGEAYLREHRWGRNMLAGAEA